MSKRKRPADRKPPKWILGLLKAVRSCWEYHSNSCQVNFQSAWDDGDLCWHIRASPIRQEIFGGAKDGQETWSGFVFDVMDFCRSPGVWVQEQAVASTCRNCNDHPKAMLRGKFRGHPFFLHVHLEPVEGPPGEVLDDTNGEVRPARSREV